MGTLITFAWLAGIVWSLWVALLPWRILRELRRQNEIRESEALKIISLLVRIAESPQDRSVDEASGIQAAIDAR